MTNTLYGKSLISISELSLAEIHLILSRASEFKKNLPIDLLKNKLLATCFFEPSTRTRLSFEAAMKRLGGAVIGFADSQSTSSQKGESLQDTMRMISAYSDAIVLRHPAEGSARLAAEVSRKPVINAGDGANHHPTQTLIDLFTIQECQGRLDELHIALVGDLKYGRTVHSLAQAFCHFPKTRFYFISPEVLTMPDIICEHLRGAGVRFSCHQHLEEILPRLDIVYMTRLQKERFDEAEFKKLQSQFSLTVQMLDIAKSSLKVLHPLPRVNEINVSVDHTQYACYFQQAANGLPVRQAILSLLLVESNNI